MDRPRTQQIQNALPLKSKESASIWRDGAQSRGAVAGSRHAKTIRASGEAIDPPTRSDESLVPAAKAHHEFVKCEHADVMRRHTTISWSEEGRETEHTYVCLEKEGPAAETEDGELLMRKIMYVSGSTTPLIMIAAPTRYLTGEGAPLRRQCRINFLFPWQRTGRNLLLYYALFMFIENS